MYLVWFEPASSRAEIADVVLGRLAGPLLGLGPLRLRVDVWDPASDIPAPVPTPEGETPLHAVVSVWPDAERSPGVLTVALLQRPPEQTFDEWMTRWHTRISPITEEIQPRARYVRNAVFRALTEGAPPLGGIVEEAWPSSEHVTDPMLFYCADGDPEKMHAHVARMIDEINAFVDLNTLRSVTMSEWILKS